MQFSVVCSSGIGDALILLIVSHHLKKQGYLVKTITPHRFGRWLDSSYVFDQKPDPSDALFLQINSSSEALQMRKTHSKVYTFFGSHRIRLPLHQGFDFFANPHQTMVKNVIESLRFFFHIDATPENGVTPFEGLTYMKFPKRIVIHTGSGSLDRCWDLRKFESFSSWAQDEGWDPIFLPQFPTLEEMLSFIYESGFFLGNDSGPGHIASYFQIPHIIIGKSKKQMRLWRPGWLQGAILTPPSYIPNFRGCKLREKFWRSWISTQSVIDQFQKIL